MELATAAQMKEIDRRAMEGGIPGLALMERAARAMADWAEEMAKEAAAPPDVRQASVFDAPDGEEKPRRRAMVFCGPGNNGGDGFACARLLLQRGWEVRTFTVSGFAPRTEDAQEMARRLREAGGTVEKLSPADPKQISFCLSCHVLVDALFGVGLKRPLGWEMLAAVGMMNGAGVPVLAADIPSGIETDTGRVLGGAVNADCTVTFTLPKIGLFVGEGGVRAGKVRVADIGVPRACWQEETFPVQTVEPGKLPRRPRDIYKGKCGKVYILGGAIGLTGAPVMAGEGALRSGAGLVTLAVPARVYPIVAGRCVEAMATPLGSDPRAVLAQAEENGVVLLGPGLGGENRMKRLVLTLLENLEKPVVLDADGLNAVSGHIDVLKGRKALTVLTPHDGEFKRLGGDLSEGTRLQAALSFAAETGCILVLKGFRTITAFPDGRAFVNGTGNPGMATGGSGDVLGGMIASLLGQGFPPERAVPLAVYLHGRAGDLAAEELGEYGMLPRDLIQKIPYAMKELE